MQLMNRLKDNVQKAKIAAGILDRKIYTGPLTVQIDITNSCNSDCVGCWCHSPLLGEIAMTPETKKKFLPYPLVKKLIDDLDDLGVRDIYFTGGGEPFMHPNAVEIMEYVKKKGIRCDMSNNFTLVNEKKAERLVKAGVDNMNCSVWAGSPEAYDRVHPNKTKEAFYRVEHMFKHFYKLKQKYRTNKPTLFIYDVISTLNYDDFENMVEFAFRVKVTGIDFTPTDIVPGKTDVLMLNKEQREWLADKVRNIWPKFHYWERKYNHKIEFRNYDQFLRRLQGNTEKGVYDQSIIGTIPCYAGWTFLRILGDGNVNSCLKSIRIPIGNIYEKSIKEIWMGSRQCTFRKHTIDYDVKDPYFRNIGNMWQREENGCLLCCDNLGLNLATHGGLQKLGPVKRKLVKLAKML